MQIPNIPTDNLYKFMAISGLVLFLVCLLYPQFLIADALTGGAETTAELSAIKDEAADLDREATRLVKAVERLRAGKGKMDREEYEEVQQRIQANLLANKTSRENLRAFDLKARIELAQAKRSLFLLQVMMWAIIPSLSLTILGFVLWYLRAQRYVDAILEFQAATARAQAGKSDLQKAPAVEPSIEKGTAF